MSSFERITHTDQENRSYTPRLETYARSLEMLEQTPFDLGVAADIDPVLLRGTRKSREHLKYYMDLYKAVGKSDQFLSLTRIFVNRVPSPEDHKGSQTIVAAYVHLFKNLRQDQILYQKGTNANSRILIEAPHVSFAYDFSSGLVISDEETMTLFAQQPSTDSLELHLPNPFIATGSDERVAYKALNTMPLYRNAGALSVSMRLWASDVMLDSETESHYSNV